MHMLQISFFISAFGLVVTAQYELSVGNGFAYMTSALE